MSEKQKKNMVASTNGGAEYLGGGAEYLGAESEGGRIFGGRIRVPKPWQWETGAGFLPYKQTANTNNEN